MKTLVDEQHLKPAQEDDSSGLPLRPRFLRELVVAKTEEGFLVDGASQLHVLWGESAKSILPSLIPLMDGTRTIMEIAGALPHLSAQQVREPLSSLSQWGLVEEGTENNAEIDQNPETLAFLRRYAVGCSGDEAFAGLMTCEVVLLSSEQDREALRYLQSLLARTGLPNIKCLDWKSLHSLEYGSTTRVLPVALSLSGENHEELEKLDDLCFAADLPWLRIVVDQGKDFADIGPVFDRKQSPCYRCFTQTHSRPDCRVSKQPGKMGSDNAMFWICMAAAEIVYLLGRVTAPRLAGWFRRYSLGTWNSKILCFAEIPGCPSCRPIPRNPDGQVSVFSGQVDTAVIFEDYVANRSGPLVSSGTMEPDVHALLELTKQTKRLPNCQQQSLPVNLLDLSLPVLDIPFDEAANCQTLGLSEIGYLLMMMAGVRKLRRNTGMLKRWAATAGNLGSVEVFLAVRRVNGLSPGYYFYQPQEHTLASFRRRSGSIAVDDFMGRVAACDSANLPDFMVLFTAAYHRVTSKYGPFAYRLINLDAGVAISQLRMVAASMNVSSRVANRWADDLIEDQLALDPMAEQSTALVLLGGKEAGWKRAETVPVQTRTGTPASTKAAQEFRELTAREIVQLVYRESRMTELELLSAPFVTSRELQTADRTGSEEIPLPAPSHGGVALGKVLRQRSSVRRYTGDAVSLNQVSTMLSFAQRADVEEWPGVNHDGHGLTFMVLAQGVEDLKPGVYEYDSAKELLLSRRGPLRSDEIVKLYVQNEFAAAPLAIWITGNLAAACARHGAFGHRQLLLRAGAAGNRMWMAALGLGLGGTLVAGVDAGASRKILGIDGYLKRALLAVAIGYPGRGTLPAVELH